MTDFRLRLARLSFSGESRIRFCEVLKMQLESGRSLRDAMENIHAVYTLNGRKSHPFGLLARDGMTALASNQQGNNIQDVFARWFPSEEAATLAVGLRTNSLVRALESLIALIQSLKTIRSQIVVAALAPFGALIALSGLFAMIAFQLVPPLIQLLPVARATGALALVYGIAGFTTTQGPFWLAGILLLFISAVLSLKTWTGTGRDVADNLPPWSLYRLLQGSLFLMNLSTLLSAGMGFGDALRTLHDSGSPWLKVRLRSALRHFDNGDNLGVALDKSGHHFPSREMILHLRMLSGGDQAPAAIHRLAAWWLSRTQMIAKGMLNLSMMFSVVLIFSCLGIIATSMLSLRQIMNM